MRRHAAAVAFLLAVLAAAAWASHALRARDPGPGLVWVVPRQPGGAGLARVLRQGDLRLLDVRAGGLLLLVRAPAMAALRWNDDAAWFTFNLAAGFSLRACG